MKNAVCENHFGNACQELRIWFKAEMISLRDDFRTQLRERERRLFWKMVVIAAASIAISTTVVKLL